MDKMKRERRASIEQESELLKKKINERRKSLDQKQLEQAALAEAQKKAAEVDEMKTKLINDEENISTPIDEQD